MEYSPLSPLEKQIVAIAAAQGSLAEMCVLVEYYTDKGRVPEHFRPRADVLGLVRALGLSPSQAPGFAVVPVEPDEAMLRPFHQCPPEELALAWQAMLMVVAAKQRRTSGAPDAPHV